MRKIFKYPMRVTDHQEVKMKDGIILAVQAQGKELCLWSLIDPESQETTKEFRVIGTGHPIPEDDEAFKYIGTAQMFNGNLVWHVFEVLK